VVSFYILQFKFREDFSSLALTNSNNIELSKSKDNKESRDMDLKVLKIVREVVQAMLRKDMAGLS